jgi:hypothetical protein
MIALANAELAKSVGVAVGELVRLRIAVALLAKDQPGSIPNPPGLVGEQMSDGSLFQRIVMHRSDTKIGIDQSGRTFEFIPCAFHHHLPVFEYVEIIREFHG